MELFVVSLDLCTNVTTKKNGFVVGLIAEYKKQKLKGYIYIYTHHMNA